MKSKAPVLVVAAHPDDEWLGCGATAARLMAEGREVHMAVLGEGVTSRSGVGRAGGKLLRDLAAQARAAAKALGVASLSLHRLPDNKFDSVPLLDVVKIVEGLIGRLAPDTVFTHHGGDLNVDHAVTHRAVVTATRPLPGQPVKRLLSFEVASSTEWAFRREDAFRPNVFVDVTRTLPLKLKALSYYAAEMRPFPHPRSPEALRAAAQKWGSVAGCAAAEAFELVREVP